jgi:hypothetical protein
MISHKINFTNLVKTTTFKNPILRHPCVKKIIDKICWFMDFHDTTHHNLSINKRPHNILLEFINNVMMQGGVLAIFVIVAKYLSIGAIFLWAFLYATVHIINYEFVKPITHHYHHVNKNTNFGLDVYDILFSTKYDPECLENYNHAAINLFVITLVISPIIYFIRQCKLIMDNIFNSKHKVLKEICNLKVMM